MPPASPSPAVAPVFPVRTARDGDRGSAAAHAFRPLLRIFLIAAGAVLAYLLLGALDAGPASADGTGGRIRTGLDGVVGATHRLDPTPRAVRLPLGDHLAVTDLPVAAGPRERTAPDRDQRITLDPGRTRGPVTDREPTARDRAPSGGDRVPSVRDRAPSGGDRAPSRDRTPSIPDRAAPTDRDRVPSITDRTRPGRDLPRTLPGETGLPAPGDAAPGLVPGVADVIADVADAAPDLPGAVPPVADGTVPGIVGTVPEVVRTLPSVVGVLPAVVPGVVQVIPAVIGALPQLLEPIVPPVPIRPLLPLFPPEPPRPPGVTPPDATGTAGSGVARGTAPVAHPPPIADTPGAPGASGTDPEPTGVSARSGSWAADRVAGPRVTATGRAPAPNSPPVDRPVSGVQHTSGTGSGSGKSPALLATSAAGLGYHLLYTRLAGDNDRAGFAPAVPALPG